MAASSILIGMTFADTRADPVVAPVQGVEKPSGTTDVHKYGNTIAEWVSGNRRIRGGGRDRWH